jgi:hypothetical protein
VQESRELLEDRDASGCSSRERPIPNFYQSDLIGYACRNAEQPDGRGRCVVNLQSQRDLVGPLTANCSSSLQLMVPTADFHSQNE